VLQIYSYSERNMSASVVRVSALVERVLSGQQWRSFKTATYNYYHPMMRAGRSVLVRERRRKRWRRLLFAVDLAFHS
jgi:hypothetical protein